MRILVATDGSEPARLALTDAAGLAAATGVEVVILTVSQIADLAGYVPLATHQFTPQEIQQQLVLSTPDPDEVQAILDEAGQIMASQGVHAFRLHVTGDAGERIVEVAATQGAGLIVVGSHGRTGIKRLLMGSVAEWVVRHAPCAVLVARGQPLTFRAEGP